MAQGTEESLDYDLIHAPQFIDFQELQNTDLQDEEDPAHSFFEVSQDLSPEDQTRTFQDPQNTDTEEHKFENDLALSQTSHISPTKKPEVLQASVILDPCSENDTDASVQHNLGQEDNRGAKTGESVLLHQQDENGNDDNNVSGNEAAKASIPVFESIPIVGLLREVENPNPPVQGTSISEGILESHLPSSVLNMELNIDMITAEVAALSITELAAEIPKAVEKKSKIPTEVKTALESKTSVLIPKKFDIKVTIPKPFHFHSVRQRYQATPAEKEGYTFKARPAPLKAFQTGPTGVKEKQAVKITVPMSPHFASDARIRERHLRVATPGHRIQVDGVKENENPNVPMGGALDVASARRRYRSMTPVRRGRSPSPVQKTTVIRPFSFDEREREKKLNRDGEKLRKEEDEEEARRHEFHANPLPSFKSGLPVKRPIPPTKAEPFHLKVDERGTKHQEVFRKKLEEEFRLQKEQATFYANPPTVIFKEPFVPEASQKPLTEPWDIELNSDKRAQEREMFALYMKEREIMEEERHQQEEAVRLVQEEKQTQDLRKKTVHKAQPMKGLRAFEVKQSNKPLTTPMSPAFAPLPSQRRNLQQIHANERT